MKTTAAAIMIAAAGLTATAAVARDNVTYEKQLQLQEWFSPKVETSAPQTSVSNEGIAETYVDPNSRVRDVSPELNEWLDRNHARPAGR